MKLATKTRYGVRLMVDLAEHANCGIVPLKDVAARQGISKKYLGQVATPLVTAGLVHVERGVNGGYQLARDPRNITIADIVHATEDGFGLIECTSKANLAAIPSLPTHRYLCRATLVGRTRNRY